MKVIDLRGLRRLILPALVVLSSCVSALDLDSYKSATDTFCGHLQACYALNAFNDCTSLVSSAVEKNAKLIGDLTSPACLDSACSQARHCLDTPDLCVALGASCTVSDACCGGANGLASCDGTSRTCCAHKGTSCASHADCCKGAGACDPSTKTCGGFVCKAPGASCDTDGACCSGHCSGGMCGEACLADGFDCSAAKDCCSEFCSKATGHCGQAPTAALGEPCDLAQGIECLEGTCVTPDPSRASVCSNYAVGYPEGIDCTSDAECGSGYCNPATSQCALPACSSVGDSCSSSAVCCPGLGCKTGQCAQCAEFAEACQSGGDCCSDQCIIPPGKQVGVCGAACTTGDCKHDQCHAGGPLDASNSVDCEPTFNPACVQSICDVDPYCCCHAWDETCVNEAKTVSACTGACP